jgi:hypothetical protein
MGDGDEMMDRPADTAEGVFVVGGDTSGPSPDLSDISDSLVPQAPIIIRSAEQMDAVTAAQKTIVANSQSQATVMADILNERERQDAKWGPVPRLEHDFGKWLQILMEEIGEASEENLDATWVAALESKPIEGFMSYRQVDIELTQAAAVLVAWLEHRAAIREEQRR